MVGHSFFATHLNSLFNQLMIKELWNYLTTPTTKEARAMGYLYQSVALEARATRCLSAWQSHIDKCHRFILDEMSHVSKAENILILGSGTLTEIPMEAILKKFKKITLVDIVHVKSVRAIAKKYEDQITLIEADITGVLGQVYAAVGNQFDFEKIKYKNEFLKNTPWDFVVSANLLSQLPIAIRSYLVKRYQITDEQFNLFAQKLQQAHLDYLKSLHGHKVIYTDIEFYMKDTKGKTSQTVPTVFCNYEPKKQKRWNWNVAPIPEASKDYAIEMHVVAGSI